MPPLECSSDAETASTKRSVDELYITSGDISPQSASKRVRIESPPTSTEDDPFCTNASRPTKTLRGRSHSNPNHDQSKATCPAIAQSTGIRIPGSRQPASAFKKASSVSLDRAFQTLRLESGAGTVSSKHDYAPIKLTDFTVYRQVKDGSYALVTLDTTSSKFGHSLLYFDGTAQIPGCLSTHDLRTVPFETLSVEGYGSEPQLKFWVKSTMDRRLWFELTTPSSEYRHYWDPFIWVARFTKYFIEFCAEVEDVPLEALKAQFINFLDERHLDDAAFHPWRSQHPALDFRQQFTRYRGFVWKEISSVLPEVRDYSIWKDIAFGDFKALPQQPIRYKDKTIITPSVYNLLKDTYFGSVLKPVNMAPEVIAARSQRLKSMGFARAYAPRLSDFSLRPQFRSWKHRISVGDVVGVPPDDHKSLQSAWRRCTANIWWAYVQGKREMASGTKLEVLWLYRPEHTFLGDGYYPFANELFLSQHCNCKEIETLDESHVTHLLDVAWSPKALPTDRAFVRHRYTNEPAISSLDKTRGHFQCEHKIQKQSVWDQVKSKYKVGDTVLAAVGESETLEPFVIDAFTEPVLKARALLRANREFAEQGTPNELIWTDVIVDLRPSYIRRRCYIRFCPRGHPPPTPYNRNGQADCFFIATRLEGGPHPQYRDLTKPYPQAMNEGFLPGTDTKGVLPGLSLFSGGGNFDFGLEDSGAVAIDHHIEWDNTAAHTLRANCSEQTKIWCGSVDDYLYHLASGTPHVLIARIGTIDFIGAGSPCQGFSMMQNNKFSTESLINASKVASVASFIDIYRPKYALLENVPEMASKHKETGVSVLDQLLCAVVAMGYQVKVFNIVAYSMGEPQMRSRLFVSITAPGLPQPEYPPITHHDSKIDCRKLNRALGTTMNGVKFGLPEIDLDDAAPFQVVTASQATQDLPDIADGHMGICIPFPDHRLPRTMSARDQLIVNSIPRFPRAQGLRDISIPNHQAGTFTGRPGLPLAVSNFIATANPFRVRSTSKSMQRVDPDQSFKTVTTHPTPCDAKTGQILHWDQHRCLTVMEARRAQGFLDDQIILGETARQWKIIGNSVARGVGLALGQSLGRVVRGEL